MSEHTSKPSGPYWDWGSFQAWADEIHRESLGMEMAPKVAVPCSGQVGLNKANHLWRLDEYDKRLNQYARGSWVTVEQVPEGYEKSNSHGICPECYEYVMEAVSRKKREVG